MSVELEPSELGFKRPFNQEKSQTLRLRNPHSEPVAFKVKTTAPKQYCVRPNSGKIDPGEYVEVQVLLQAMKEDPPLDARCKDKFLVQSVVVSASQDLSNVHQIWNDIQHIAKSTIQEKKIRVNFLPADGATNGVASDEAPPAYSTGRRNSPSTPQKGGDMDKSFADTTETAHSPQQSTLGAAASAVAASIPTSQEDMKRQLDAANSKIQQLQQAAADGLRQRKAAVTGGEKSGASGTSLQTAPAPGGVTVQMTAILCLLSFLIAYLFF